MLFNYRYYSLLVFYTAIIIVSLLIFSTSVATAAATTEDDSVRKSFNVEIELGILVFTRSKKADDSNYSISFVTNADTTSWKPLYYDCYIELFIGQNKTCTPLKSQKPVCQTGKFNLGSRPTVGPPTKNNDDDSSNSIPTIDNSSGPDNGVPLDCKDLDSANREFTLKLNGINKDGQGGDGNSICVPIKNTRSSSKSSSKDGSAVTVSGNTGFSIFVAGMVGLGLFSSFFDF
ncbi:hypothetical protein H4219_006265 [Mycoemilia scoparia]|uniref:Uncharacterized protein n=1 Tax=Mycoemilia scoparia TaxID=417184 RepID=A0A9W7ZPN4_9FUNG|nr:hypothetical protein H4219_006265 [Mycoemilia scoparia]